MDQTKKTKSITKKSNVKVIKKKTENKITLLPHQFKPIRYLVAKCPDQHGLLLQHAMGSGKTNLALFLAKNYPKSNLVVIIPFGLDSVWVNSAKALNMKIKLLLTYRDLTPELLKKHEKVIKDSVLVMDEAHHLIEIIENITSDQKTNEEDNYQEFTEDKSTEPEFDQKTRQIKKDGKVKAVKKEAKNALIEILDIFKSAKKVLLLSGTPIKKDLADFRWLINIAAGKKIFPYNKKEFEEKFYYKSPTETFLYGWIDNIMNLTRDPLTGKFLVKDEYYFQFQQIQQPNHYNTLLKVLTTGVGFVFGNDIIKSINNKQDFLERAKQEIFLKINQEKGLFDNLIKYFFPEKGKKFTFLDLVGNLALSMILSGGPWMVTKAKQKLIDDINYDKLNLNKIAIASSYISYYEADDINYYPKRIDIVKSIGYTNYQLDLFTRLVGYMNITDNESVNLELNKNVKEAELFKPSQLNNDIFSKARKIGNLFGIDPITGKRDIPTKFIRIADYFEKNGLQTMVYSSFHESLIDLGNYLKERKISYIYFTPDIPTSKKYEITESFNNGKIKMLLLHPVFYEGFSIKGCRIFHVLEPVDQYYKREQLYTRTVRFKSHTHLPINERNVKIIQWKCSIEGITEYIKRNKTEFSNWFAGDKETVYFARYKSYMADFTPDDSFYNQLEYLANKIKDFNKKMETLRIDNNNNIKRTCNVYGEIDMVRGLKKCYK